MQKNTNWGCKTEQQFRENAMRFFLICREKQRMPYLEGVFIEIVCMLYAILKDGGRPTISFVEKGAVERIKKLYPEMSKNEILKKIREIYKGEKIKELFDEDWFDFCCNFRHIASSNYSQWNEYCVNVTCKQYDCEHQYKTSYRCFQKEIVHLLLTIELL